MKITDIKNDDGAMIHLEYDDDKYDVQYIKHKNKEKNVILLKRLADNMVLEVFSDKIGFIVQRNKDQQVNFLVTDYSEALKNENVKPNFTHYVETESAVNYLEVKKEFECDTPFFEDLKIADNSFIVEASDYGGAIYNLDKKSANFDYIYNDDQIIEMFDEGDTVLVTEVKTPFTRRDIIDRLTYGINVNTLEITTPIWSELQQRFINIYSQEKADALTEKLVKEGQWVCEPNYTPGELTMLFEVDNYLNILKDYIDKPRCVYSDVLETEVNKEFVKKFTEKKD